MSKNKSKYIITTAIILASLTGLAMVVFMLSTYKKHIDNMKNNATRYEIHITRKNLKINKIRVEQQF